MRVARWPLYIVIKKNTVSEQQDNFWQPQVAVSKSIKHFFVRIKRVTEIEGDQATHFVAQEVATAIKFNQRPKLYL